MKKYYIDSYITHYYPYDITRHISDSAFGVLNKYMYKVYTRDEIDAIICELITRHPYIDNSMRLGIRIMWMDEHNTRGYYHILDIPNDNYENQQRKINVEIKYEK